MSSPTARRDLDYPALGKRLLACIAGSLVLALMWGEQEGTQEDFGLAFHQAIFDKRIVIFLGIGVAAFFAITFWPTVRPYLTKPGMPSFLTGGVTVIASYVLLHWYDPVSGQKLSDLSDLVGSTPSDVLSPITFAFFGWLHWTALLVLLAVGVYALAAQQRITGFVVAGLSLVMAIVVVVAREDVIDAGKKIDHSLGSFVAVAGFLVMAVAMASAAQTKEQAASSRASVDRFLNRIPGLPLVIAGLLVTVLALTMADWFSPLGRNAGYGDLSDLFGDTSVSGLTLAYMQWLGWVLVLASAALAGAGAYLRRVALGWAGAAVAVVSIVLTLYVLYDFSDVAAALHVESATGPWQNLGVGGWVACIGLTLIAGGAGVVVIANGGGVQRRTSVDGVPVAPRDKMSPSTRNLILLGVALALFFPPTMTEFWQKVLVSEIGVYVLLAVGLNVVVGWAGLLDLGFIAFYAIGSYTTAYVVGSLPRKPPDWLHLSPLWAIPFAVVVCLLAGLALGAPTLRLRGDYLAIVTLGFGEIIRITAINNPGQITNSTRGTQPAVPHPVIDLGFIRFEWSLNNLQYWYLLLVILSVVVVLFYRLEGSRLGRAWAAIREDEVAAQATGINTVKVKLLAFAIGASTSGVAGVFFASQVGYFNPDNFKLENSILVVAYVVFGGMGSLPGAMAGAAVLTWLPEFLKDQVPADDRQMWIGAVVLLMMIFRPAGLLPAKRRRAELEGLEGTDSSEVRAVPASEGV